jgi:hypothetical protein
MKKIFVIIAVLFAASGYAQITKAKLVSQWFNLFNVFQSNL